MKRRTSRRTNWKAEVQIPFPKLLANALVVIAVTGVCYVSLCARCEQLGQDIKRLESDRHTARLQLINEQDRWSNLQAPANFDRVLKRHGLVMTLPGDRRVIRVHRSNMRPSDLVLAYMEK